MDNNQTASKDTSHSLDFDVDGMTCAACVTNVEKALSGVEGVEQVVVNLATESAHVVASNQIALKSLEKAVGKMGYSLQAKGSTSLLQRQQQTIANWRRQLIIQAIFGVPLLLYAMTEMISDVQLLPRNMSIVLQFVFTSILVITGHGYYRRGFKHMLAMAPNMDSLVALGTGAAFIYSIFSSLNLIFQWGYSEFESLYYEAAGTILLFITFGKWLESVARGKTTEALSGLADRMPREGEVKRDGSWERIPLEQIVVGDIVRIKPHTKVPVDGLIIKGESSLDEAAISGESLPVDKKAGESVIAATINQGGVLEVKAEKVGRDSLFGQVIQLVESAQSRKPKIQQQVDKIAGIFVPVVLITALAGGLFWILAGYGLTFSLNVMISVLIIACPCALGLATPTAIVVGSGIAAQWGILIKSPDAMSVLSKIHMMIFDKTGTLTEGKPKVVALTPLENYEHLRIAAGLSSHSQHPLARAVTEEAESRSLTPPELSDVRESPGFGIEGLLGDRKVGLHKVEDPGTLRGELSDAYASYQRSGQIVSAISSDEAVIGLIAFADELKPESAAVINFLRERHVETLLLTGDRYEIAAKTAAELNISTFEAEILPQGKQDVVKANQAQGKMVGMIGDGINDAPALVLADVGLSFGRGTEIAINAADIIFMNDSLTNVNRSYLISQATIGKIRQNLFWAFFYNSIGIPIALGVLYPFTQTLLNPMFAGMAMAFSSVSVVVNTLMLKRKNFGL